MYCSSAVPQNHLQNLYKSWDTSEQSYEITIEYQGTFRSNGSVQPDVFQRIDVDPIAKEKQQTLQSKTSLAMLLLTQFLELLRLM